ncbi:MAG: hypothetical protein ACRDDW_04545 [Candidatus Rhabdochlamydia sp.]
MQKIYLLLSSLLVCNVGFTLYTGNPGSPGIPEEGLFLSKESWLRIKAGYEYDHVQDRKIKVLRQNDLQVKKISTAKLVSNFGTFTASINQRMDLYFELGNTQAEFVQRLYESGPDISYKSHSHFAWGGGGRAILVYWGDTQIGLAASYRAVRPDLYAILIDQESYLPQKTKMFCYEWQVSMGLYHRFSYFIPYIALQCADFQTKIRNLPALPVFPRRYFAFKSQHLFGLVLGFGLTNQRGVDCNFEARFFNEKAFTLSADVSF